MYAPVYSIKRLADIQAPGTWIGKASGIWSAAIGRWQVVCGICCVPGGMQHMVAEIITSVDIIVWILSLVQPPQQDLTLPNHHGVDMCSNGYCRNGRWLVLGVNRSPTQIFQQNLLNGSRWFLAAMCAFGPGVMVMIAIAKAMAMAIAMPMPMPMPMVFGDWDHSTRSAWTCRLAMSALKLPQAYSHQLDKLYTMSELRFRQIVLWTILLLPKCGSPNSSSLKQAL